MTKLLSPTQAQILAAAAQYTGRLAEPPSSLPAAARKAVLQSMLRAGLLEEVLVSDSASPVLRITVAGLEAAGVERGLSETMGETAMGPQEGREGQGSTTALPNTQEAPATSAALRQTRMALRGAAADLLVAWDAGEGRPELAGAVAALRAAFSRAGVLQLHRDPSAPRRPRDGTKRQAILTFLRRPEGAIIAQVMEATGWAQHTVRGSLAGLKGKRHTIEVLEQVRQVGGSGREGQLQRLPHRRRGAGLMAVLCRPYNQPCYAVALYRGRHQRMSEGSPSTGRRKLISLAAASSASSPSGATGTGVVPRLASLIAVLPGATPRSHA